MPTKDPREKILTKRANLVSELQISQKSADQQARNRLSAIRQGIRDIAVQATATVLGGAVLAGLAQLLGLLPRDPVSILTTALAVLALAAALATSIVTYTNSSITTADLKKIKDIQNLDEVLALLDSDDEQPDPPKA